jgi:peptidoglycan/xylan/chitin deacetylase (PgdA/CDA1 family)
MNASVKAAAATCLDRAGVLTALRRFQSANQGLVLMFHRVLPRPDRHLCYDPHLVMAEDVFDALLALLVEKYRVVSLSQLVAGGGGGRRPRVAITFDDAWEDTYSIACPLLHRYNLPATVFLCPQLMTEAAQGAMIPEERFARIWDHCESTGKMELLQARLQNSAAATRKQSSDELKKLPMQQRLPLLAEIEHEFSVPGPRRRSLMTWDEAKTMARDEITLGSHTLRHCTLTSENTSVLMQELTDSRAEILRQTGVSADFLAYPNGAVNSQVAQSAREAGYSYAFTTQAGFVREGTDAWTAPRLAMEDAPVTGAGEGFHKSRAKAYLQLLK